MPPAAIESFRFLGISLGILISIAGAIGNSLAIIAYFTTPRMRTAFNLMVVNLAMVDFITSTIVMPFAIYGYYKMEWLLPEETCVAFGYFYYSAHYTSALFLVVISYNRYMHVSRPHASYALLFSLKRRRCIGGLTWCISPIFLLPLVFTGGFGWWESGLLCTYTRSTDFTSIYSIAMRLVFQLVPLICMMALYFAIFRAVKKSHAVIDKKRAERSNSFVLYSEGVGTTTTPLSPTNVFSKHNYKLQVSSTSPSTVRPTPRSDFLSPNKKASSSLVETQEENQQKERKKVRRSNTENSSDFKIATLRKQTINSRYASICRSQTAENMLTLPIAFLIPPESLSNGLNTTSRTNLSNSLNQSTQSITEKKNSQSSGLEVKTLEVPKRPNQLYIPQRQRNATALPDYSPTSKPRFTRARNMSLPSLSKTKRLSNSFTNIIDQVRHQAAQREKRKAQRSLQHAKAQRKLLYMCIVICSAYAICSLPSLILNLVGDYNSILPEYHMLTTNLSWLTTLVNPIVYAAMNMQFRKEYTRLLKMLVNKILNRSQRESTQTPNIIPTIHISESDH